MTTYSVGFTIEQLTQVELTADKYLLGTEMSYTPSIVRHQFDEKDKNQLRTFCSLIGYEGKEYYDTENHSLLKGDTVIVSWWVSFIYIHQMIQDGINVIIVKTDYGDIIGIL